ncbi:MAG: hypothetical protein CVV23_07625 [Ignavibacteriae bacterium HGW-Ignavibacteriae-2]|nr:MAG: hypothetical protein CVV23_07625 [Ignavibacteriae bacterium HGW-Ignavibacteriae-2]
MKPLVLIIFSIMSFSFFMVNCSTDNGLVNTLDTKPEFLTASHSGCQGLHKINDKGSLEYFNYENDTLLLKINFTANCCPDFIDSVAVNSEKIQIFLFDALANCRCICNYSDIYKFYYPGFTSATLEFWCSSVHNTNYELLFAENLDL